MTRQTKRSTKERVPFEAQTADVQLMRNSYEEELAYQASRASRIGDVERTPADVIERYRKHQHWNLFSKEYMFHAMGDISGKLVFDFGCGEGELSTQLAKLGAMVSGVDISPELIAIARKRAQLDDVADRVQFHAADVLQSPPDAGCFDILICYAVLHHVDINQTFPILSRSVKPGGLVVIVEPIALSPSLQKFRDALPVKKDASPDEHQLNRAELSFVLKGIHRPQIRYFNLLGRLSRFLPDVGQTGANRTLTKYALFSLLWIDWVLIATFPFLRKYCGQVVITTHMQS